MRWVWRAESGAGKVEYGAVILLVAGITAAVMAFGLPGDVRSLLERSMCLVPGDQECEEVAGGDSGDGGEEPGDGEDGSGNGDDESGNGDDESDEGDQTDDPSPDEGQAEDDELDPELRQDLIDSQNELADAEEDLEEAQSSYDEIFDELLDLLKDLIGLQDAEDCLTEGDIVACIWTVVGFAPWGKAAKVAKKIPDIIGLVTKWRRRSGKLDDARDNASDARTTADDVVDRCPNSFSADTPVLLAGGGSVAIEDIETGDVVVATDPDTGRTASQPVTRTFTSTGTKDLVTVTVLDGAGGGRVTATDDHPIWVENRQNWVKAGDLRPGDLVRAPDGATVTVSMVHAFSAFQSVHNLTVRGLHTYYVSAGDTSVLAHNCPRKQGKRLSNKQADKAARELGYEDAHDLKEQEVGGKISRWDIAKGNDGSYYLESKDGKVQIPLDE